MTDLALKIENEIDEMNDEEFDMTEYDEYADEEMDETPADEIEEIYQVGGGGDIGANTDAVLRRIVDNYLKENKKFIRMDFMLANKVVKTKIADNDRPYWKPCLDKIRDDILYLYDDARVKINHKKVPGATKLKSMVGLPGWVIAQILMATGDVKVLDTTTPEAPDEGSRVIVRKHYFKASWTNGVYRWSGQYSVINDHDKADEIMKIIRILNRSIDRKSIGECLDSLNDAPVVMMHASKTLIGFRNGVWDFETKKATSYWDPDFAKLYPNYVTLGKFVVNHPLLPMWGNQKPMKFDKDGKLIEPVYICHDGSEWRPSEQLKAPFEIGTPEGDASYDCYLRFAQFTLRGMNGKPGYYMFWVNGNGDGTNGKGCAGDIIELMLHDLAARMTGCEDLLSRPVVIVAAVDELGKDHNLGSNLLSAKLIRGQETNATNGYVENCALMKLLARSQPYTYRDLYKMPMSIAFDGGLLQESNYTPIFSDKSVSTIRAALVIKFNKHFGTDFPEIKADFLPQDDVRSWFAWFFTTQLPCYDRYDKQSTDILKGNAVGMLKESMNTAQFFDEALPLLPLDVIDWSLLYFLYERWCRKNGIQDRQRVNGATFKRDMEQYANMPGSPVAFQKTLKQLSTKDFEASEHTDIPALERWGFDSSAENVNIDLRRSKYAISKPEYIAQAGPDIVIKKTLLNWSDYIVKDKNTGKVKVRSLRNVFVRKVSHFEEPLECEKPVVMDEAGADE